MMQELTQKITKDMTIGEVVRAYPASAEILMEEGIHCVGCGAANFETLEQGLGGHGRSPEEIDEIVQMLNDAIPSEAGSSEDLIITDNAARKLREFVEKQGKKGSGMRISVQPGGCAGMSYNFDLAEKPLEGDHVVEVLDMKFYVDGESFELLRGAKVDYVETLAASGFKISNPNAKSTCGCGQSFQ
ncbi:MAG: iron-sulfur cluster assembly accessory protein [Nitrosarchaeum sp.]|nr:iron-sulfur cluster assembly accessory protein [Nitrosarchaeum sp.]